MCTIESRLKHLHNRVRAYSLPHWLLIYAVVCALIFLSCSFGISEYNGLILLSHIWNVNWDRVCSLNCLLTHKRTLCSPSRRMSECYVGMRLRCMLRFFSPSYNTCLHSKLTARSTIIIIVAAKAKSTKCAIWTEFNTTIHTYIQSIINSPADENDNPILT